VAEIKAKKCPLFRKAPGFLQCHLYKYVPILLGLYEEKSRNPKKAYKDISLTVTTTTTTKSYVYSGTEIQC
jgi:hypothetical protein